MQAERSETTTTQTIVKFTIKTEPYAAGWVEMDKVLTILRNELRVAGVRVRDDTIQIKAFDGEIRVWYVKSETVTSGDRSAHTFGIVDAS